MNKLEEKHLEAIEEFWMPHSFVRQQRKEAATTSAEITKEYAEMFDVWKDQHGWQTALNGMYYKTIQPASPEKTFSELWNLFLNDLNEKG